MTEPASKEGELNVRSSDVVADAVIKSYWEIMNQGGYHDPKKTVGELFEESTSGMCRQSSINTIGYIAKAHSELFEHLLTITTYEISPDSWLTGGNPNYIDNPPYHTYFLVKDKNGYWYAGSPANDKANDDPDYATTIFRDESLETIIKQIDERDKVKFPAAHYIEESLKKLGSSFKIINGRKLEYRQFIQVNSKNSFSSSEEFLFPSKHAV